MEETKTRELLKPFGEIIMQIIPTMGTHLANLEIADNPSDAQQVKICWWRIRRQIDDYVAKIDKELKAELKAGRKGKHPKHPVLHSTLQDREEKGIAPAAPLNYDHIKEINRRRSEGNDSAQPEVVQDEQPLINLNDFGADDEIIDEF